LSNLFINLSSIFLKSSDLFWHLCSPANSPLKQLGGWDELGGMYRYRFMSFWKVDVCILECSMLIFRSRKVVVVESSSVIHSSLPQLLSSLLKLFHVVMQFRLGGRQTPKISSM
jgi:hypothetical protein